MVKPDELSNLFDSSIPDLVKTDVSKAIEKPHTGEVTMVADKCEFAQVGDKIMFNPWAGVEVDDPNALKLVGKPKTKLLIMDESEVKYVMERIIEVEDDIKAI